MPTKAECERIRQENRRLRADNERLRYENVGLQIAVQRAAAKERPRIYGRHELTAGTSEGPRRRGRA